MRTYIIINFLIETQPFSVVLKSQNVTSKPIPIEVTQNETIKIGSELSPDYVKVDDHTNALIGKSCGQCMAGF